MPWSWVDGLVLIGLFVVTQVVAGGVGLAVGLDPARGVQALLIGGLGQLLAIPALLGWLAARGALSRQLLGGQRLRLRQVAVGGGVGVAGFVVVIALLQLAVVLLGRRSLPTQETFDLITGAGPASIAVGFVVAMLLAPVVEELIYRSVLFQALRTRVGVIVAAVLSSLLWAAMHLELVFSQVPAGEPGQLMFEPVGLVSIAGIVLLGLWLAGAFHRAGGLVVTVVGHSVFNGINLVLALVTTSA